MTNRVTMYDGKVGTLYVLKGEFDSSLGIFLDGDTGLRPCIFRREEKTYDSAIQQTMDGEKGYWHYENEYFANALLRAGNIIGVNGCRAHKFEIKE